MRPAVFAARCLLVFAALVNLSTPAAAQAKADRESVAYRPPVAAPVVDPYRPPDERWEAGNRGIDYDTEPGVVVRAAASGEVVFAGPVAGSLHVVVLHPDGIRTSYSFLASVEVHRGDRVVVGQPVGTAGDALHFGARAGEEYIDPSLLLAGEASQVHLVPESERRSNSEAQERSWLEKVVSQIRTGMGSLGEATADWLRKGVHEVGERGRAAAAKVGEIAAGKITGAIEELRLWLHYLKALGYQASAVGLAVEVGGAILAWERARGNCTKTEVPAPKLKERHLLVEVAGLGSHTGDGAEAIQAGAVSRVDAQALGYAPKDVIQFSYKGGTTSENAYAAEDTQVDIRHSGQRLRDLLERIRYNNPGVPVDIIAHSQGGLVTRLALGESDVPFDSRLPEIRSVITLGTPNQGAHLATMGEVVGQAKRTNRLVTRAEKLHPTAIDPNSSSVKQLSEVSSFIREWKKRPLPGGVRWHSIAARGDVVVPPDRAHLKGATNVVVSVGNGFSIADHDSLPSSPAAQREMALALAGAPPTCETLVDAIADTVTSRAISTAEDAAGAGLLRYLP